MAKNLLSEEKMKELSKAMGADEVSFIKYFKLYTILKNRLLSPIIFTKCLYSN